MFAIKLLLILVMYIFGVMTTQLYKESYQDGVTSVDYFGRLDRSFFTLFQIMTLDNWSEVTRELLTAYDGAWIPIMSFVILSGLVVVNLIVAVVCDAVAALHKQAAAEEEEEMSDPEMSKAGHVTKESFTVQLAMIEHKTQELTRLQNETMLVLYKLTRAIESQSNEQ
jgi:Ion transport protein